MRYRVGQRVVLARRPTNVDERPGWTWTMDNHLGKLATVTQIVGDSNEFVRLKFDDEDDDFGISSSLWYAPTWLLPHEEEVDRGFIDRLNNFSGGVSDGLCKARPGRNRQ